MNINEIILKQRKIDFVECIEQVNRWKGFVMGFQWFFLLLLFSFVCDWLFTSGDDSLKEINDTKLLGPVIQKNRVAEAVVTWIATTTENRVASSIAVTWIAQVVPAQALARQVILTSTVRQQLKQERHGIQTSIEFAARLSRLQNSSSRINEDFKKEENLSVLPRNKMEVKTAFNAFDEFDEAEDTHFLYYIAVFCAIIVCVYFASHNKNKILGFIIEGRRSSNSARRTTLRYKRLSQHDHSGSDL
ncbi:putative integral membrane protein [Brugia pahangi]